jgi:predicted AlkP superfamily phosphohydrolase/phosphomutase
MMAARFCGAETLHRLGVCPKVLFCVLLAITQCSCTRSHAGSPAATGKRIVILGIDGMDPQFLERHWGSLPNLSRLREEGEFKRLETIMPPQSPVAWSTFITGMDPGGHGIYDFVHRDPNTLMPFSSMAQTAEGGRTISIGPYVLPLSKGEVKSFRKGKPFWQVLAEHHVATNIIRMPTNFPPDECEDGHAVSGMGTPDLRGTFGTFAYYTDDPKQNSRQVPGGEIVKVQVTDNQVDLRIHGPDNTLRKDRAPSYVNLTVHLDPSTPVARFDMGDTRVVLREGDWSDWIHTRFPLIPEVKSAAGMFRIYAKKLRPDFAVYISPINIDPGDPELPITAPASYTHELFRTIGPFYTQGMAQDTSALRQAVFNRDEYLNQSRQVSEQNLKLLRYGLDHFSDGVLFFHFFGVDQNSHMLWGKYEDQLLDTYKLVDNTVGWVRAKVSDAHLIVMSDHGFAAFDRAVHLNTWLMKQGFLTLDDPKNTGPDELFKHVDWSATQAYSVGLNGLYLNLRGRERDGIVNPGPEADLLLDKIKERLLQFRDPDNGKPIVYSVTLPSKEFHGQALESAPDMIVGYYPGYRSSWQTALGAIPAKLVEDNTEEWRGDHCISAKFVPGVLISNRKSQAADPHLYDLTASILSEFGVPVPADMIGHTIYEKAQSSHVQIDCQAKQGSNAADCAMF